MNRTNSGLRQARTKLRTLALAAAALGATAMFAGSATAKQYPAKNITALVPFAAGGGADTQTRIWGGAIAPKQIGSPGRRAIATLGFSDPSPNASP